MIPPHLNNTPGARTAGTTWVDHDGNLWLFGGYGKDAAGNSGYLNDLWKYEIAYNEWTWVKGSDTVNSPGHYGTIEIPHADNNPPARSGGISWVDNNGNLWLFGGETGGGGINYKNDLWRYNITSHTWTLFKGSTGINSSTVPGIEGTEALNNTPGEEPHLRPGLMLLPILYGYLEGIKTCMNPKLVYEGEYSSDSLTATYFSTQLTNTFKSNLAFFINYLDTIKD